MLRWVEHEKSYITSGLESLLFTFVIVVCLCFLHKAPQVCNDFDSVWVLFLWLIEFFHQSRLTEPGIKEKGSGFTAWWIKMYADNIIKGTGYT